MLASVPADAHREGSPQERRYRRKLLLQKRIGVGLKVPTLVRSQAVL